MFRSQGYLFPLLQLVILLVPSACSEFTTAEFLKAAFTDAPTIVQAEQVNNVVGEAGHTQIQVTFSGPVYGNKNGSGQIDLSAFNYTDQNLTGAGSIANVSDGNGADSSITLELDTQLNTTDAGDLLHFLKDSIFGENGQPLVATDRNITISLTAPAIVSANTMDADGDLQIDHYRIVFSTNIIDNTFPGYVLDSPGNVQSSWLVDGNATNVVLVHGNAAPVADTVNDNILYLQFRESGELDTGDTPELTTTGSPGVLDFDPTPMAAVGEADIEESDGVPPSLAIPAGLVGSTGLRLTFSEPVYTGSTGGNLNIGDFNYNDGSGANAASLIGLDDADGSDSVVTVTANTNFDFADTDDTIVIAAGRIFDTSGNSMSPGSFNINTGVKQMALGENHTCALFYTGKVRCWGLGLNGQLGYNDTSTVGDGIGGTIAAKGDVPVGAEVAKIAAGKNHTCAVLTDGNLRCWGLNSDGQLGYENLTNVGDGIGPSIIAAGNVNTGATVVDVVLGEENTFVLTDNGRVLSWGRETDGRMGNGFLSQQGDEPGEMPPGEINMDTDAGMITKVAFAENHGCALASNGNVRCWGSGLYGKLGSGDENMVAQNPPIVDVGGTAIDITVGDDYSCAVLDDFSVHCWGEAAMLGIGINSNNVGDFPGEMPPVTATDLGGIVEKIFSSQQHTCGLLSTKDVRCWGPNAETLGYMGPSDVGDGPGEMPPPDGVGQNLQLGGNVAEIFAAKSGYHTCALKNDGTVKCWGFNSNGKLGLNNTDNLGDTAGDMPPPDVPLY